MFSTQAVARCWTPQDFLLSPSAADPRMNLQSWVDVCMLVTHPAYIKLMVAEPNVAAPLRRAEVERKQVLRGWSGSGSSPLGDTPLYPHVRGLLPGNNTALHLLLPSPLAAAGEQHLTGLLPGNDAALHWTAA
eukprot:scaffold139348_cov21-Tisochrysis_lutea.AAC.1